MHVTSIAISQRWRLLSSLKTEHAAISKWRRNYRCLNMGWKIRLNPNFRLGVHPYVQIPIFGTRGLHATFFCIFCMPIAHETKKVVLWRSARPHCGRDNKKPRDSAAAAGAHSRNHATAIICLLPDAPALP